MKYLYIEHHDVILHVMASDLIDLIQEQWARERPDLDSAGFGITGRLLLLGKLLGTRAEHTLAPLDLSQWSLDVLATLRRSGPPFRMTPTALSRATMLTSGAMTNRLDRLEKRGLVRREPDPDDRRGCLVILTHKGRDLAELGAATRFTEAAAFAAYLSAAEQKRLENLLRKLIVALEKAKTG